METVLGIGDRYHDSNAALVAENGKILFAAAEERFSRIKKHGFMVVPSEKGFPKRTISWILQSKKPQGKKTKNIAVAGLGSKEFFQRTRQCFLFRKRHSLRDTIKTHAKNPKNFAALALNINASKHNPGYHTELARFGLGKAKYFDHHFCHAASAFYSSGYKKTAVLTIDYLGDWYSGSFFLGENNSLERKKFWWFDSLTTCKRYDTITAMLGYNPIKHAGKITGLAAFGKPNKKLEQKLLDYFKTEIKKWDYLEKPIEQALHNDRKKFSKYRDADIALALQQITEKSVLELLESLKQNYSINRLALAGGLFANVKLNMRIHDACAKKIFIHPAMGDEGTAYGAAALLLAKKGLEPKRLNNVYFGPEYSERQIETELKKQSVKFEKVRGIEMQIAELLAKGKVIARFDGRMEYGPRALGNRSILCQPTDKTVNDWLNKRLKRTEFMPFAPSILKEHAKKCLLNTAGAEYTAEFMNIAFDCTPWFAENCPAVVHIDNTARPQLVSKSVNNSYYKIIDEYRKITGLPAIINTSFNMHEEPIVCSPFDAIRAFKLGHLDYLAIGNCLAKNTQTKKSGSN